MFRSYKTSTLFACLAAACILRPYEVPAEPMNGALMQAGPFAVYQRNSTPESLDRGGFDPAEEFGGGAVADERAPARAIQMLSRQTERAIAACYLDKPDCIADALDAYAAGLEELAPEWPMRLRSLPRIVETAARRVRNSVTKAGALQAVKIAIALVHKTIALVRADDPIWRKAASREGAFVAGTL